MNPLEIVFAGGLLYSIMVGASGGCFISYVFNFNYLKRLIFICSIFGGLFFLFGTFGFWKNFPFVIELLK